MPDLRSCNGCWTCKLRRKKCDERRPNCLTCEALQIPCYGFAKPRPQWMDGEARIQRLAQIKNTVKSTASRRRPSSRSHSVTSIISSSETESELLGHDASAVSQLNDEPFPGCVRTPFANYETSGSSLDNINVQGSSAPSPFHLLDFAALLEQPVEQCVTEHFTAEFHNNSADPLSGMAATRASDPASSLDEGNDIVTQLVNRSTSFRTLDCHATAELPHNYISLSFVMPYFDDFFYLIFPGWQESSSRPGRGWIFGSVIRSELAYNAVLALVRYNQELARTSKPCQSCEHALPINKKSWQTPHASALQRLEWELQKLQESQCNDFKKLFEMHIDALCGLLHIIVLELFQEQMIAAVQHLQAATRILPRATSLWKAMHNQERTATCNSDATDFSTSQNRDALASVTEFVRHYDTLLASLHRSTPLLDGALEHFYEHEEDLKTSNLFGYNTHVLILIRNICDLDQWKSSAHNCNRLSVMELARRSLDIQTALGKYTGSLNTIGPSGQSGGAKVARHSINERVTAAFAQAALIFLHVVASGSNPDIADIKDAVQGTIDVLKTFVDPSSFRLVLWPLYMSGSLASEDQQPYFRGLRETLALADNSGLTVCHLTLNAIEKVWRCRDEHFDAIDWTHSDL